jgi:predicted TPR repeat methyltransferase
MMKKFNTNFTKPSQEKLKSLLKYYQTRQFIAAETLSISITKEFPEHHFAWKVLAAVLKQTGKLSESIIPAQKSVQLAPKDPEAHNNLGNILKVLGKLNEAEASYRNALALKSDYAEAYNNLAVTLKRIGKLNEAEVNYHKAIALKSDYAEAYNNLGNIQHVLGRSNEAEISYRKAIKIKFDYAEAYKNLGALLMKFKKSKGAQRCFEKALKYHPDHEEAKHLYSALIGKTTNSPPKIYVENLFDDYAKKFENHLVNKLEYKIPKKITEIIVGNNPNLQLGSVLDLGCGTGLIGDEIKRYCSNLEGVDLSFSMLEQARAKNIYNKLIQKDIKDYLSIEVLNFDYFILADVFIYIGDLYEIFQLIKTRNKSKGKLLFSTEHTDKNNFFLEKSGRYSHSKKYIETLCNEFGYNLSYFETTNLRKSNDGFIIGGLYLLDF